MSVDDDTRLVVRSILTAIAHGTSWEDALGEAEPTLDMVSIALELMLLTGALLHTCSDLTGRPAPELLQETLRRADLAEAMNEQQPPT